MMRFLSKLARTFRTANTARPPRRAPRRAMLHLEGLEERVVLSTATPTVALHGSTLDVIVHQPNEQITFSGDKRPGQLDVFLGNKKLGHFPIAKVHNVDVRLTNHDAVTVNDSHGFPFASGTTVSISGRGSSNSLTLTGSVPLNTGESYVAGNGALDGQLTLNGTTIEFSSAIHSVTDSLPVNHGLVVGAVGQVVSLNGSNGVTQTLSGLSKGGAGDSLTFSNKNAVDLQMNSDNEIAVLNAPAAADGEKIFGVQLFGSNDQVFINVTPSTVATSVDVNTNNASSVFLFANSGTVNILGNSATFVSLGQNLGLVTSGIQANVSVVGAKQLEIVDSGNNTTQENVTVTESTITGTGLFGNNAVQVAYGDIGRLQIFTGDLTSGPAESYTVKNSAASAGSTGPIFTTPINIQDDATTGLNVAAVVTPASHLNLTLNPEGTTAGPTTVNFTALGATFLQGFNSVTASFAEGFQSIVQSDTSVTVNTFNGFHVLPPPPPPPPPPPFDNGGSDNHRQTP